MVIFEGETQRAEHELARAVVGLGRHPQNDIVLDDRTLSRFHARIERRDDLFVVVDLGAQNGVHLNGIRIEGEALLATGDRIDLGRYTAVFQAPKAGKAKNGQNGQNGHNGHHGQNGQNGHGAPSPPPRDTHGDDLDIDLDVDLDLDGDLDAGLDADLGRGGAQKVGLSARTSAGPGPSFDGASQVEYMPPTPTLVLLFNGMEVSRHELTDAGLLVGRSKQCDVVISLLGLSRKHSRVVMTDDGVLVEDLGSQNGTWVNNERIDDNRLLRHGDLLNFYDYSVLFLEDGDVEVGFPGAGFNGPNTGGVGDDLSARETDQALNPPTGVPRLRQPTTRSPLADDVPDDETALGRQRPGGKRRTDDGLNLDDLGEGSYLGDEFEDGASKQRDNPLLDDDDLGAPASKSPQGLGTELIDSPDLSRGSPDEDLEADIAFSSSAQNAEDFVGPTTAGDLQRLGDRTSTGVEIPGMGGWPTDDELEQALMVFEATSVTLEVKLKGRPYAQIPLSQPVMRLGSDPRCEISMPKSSGLRAWHVTFTMVGATVMVVRSNKQSPLEKDGRDADVGILENGDAITMGKVEVLVRMRR